MPNVFRNRCVRFWHSGLFKHKVQGSVTQWPRSLKSNFYLQ